MKIVVASTNPAKAEAVRLAFSTMFPDRPLEIEGVSAASGVPEQPMGDEETLRGARTRAANAKAARPDADYWVGLEGGVHETRDGLAERAWMAVLSKDGREGIGSTGTFYLPERIAALMREGKDLGEASDAVFEASGLKRANGAVGMLTGDALRRATYYEHALILALIPFKNPSLFAA